MVRVLYLGDVNPCRIKIGDTIIKRWSKGEIKILSVEESNKLLLDNKNFKLVEETNLSNNKTVFVEEKIDLNSMSKDELLDFSVVKGVSTDYTMNKKELRNLLKNHI